MCDDLLEEHVYPTMFGDAEVFVLQTEEGTPLRVLYVGGGFQSATYLGKDRFKPVFAYCRAIYLVFRAERPVQRMLMIGGGGFSYPKHLLMSAESVFGPQSYHGCDYSFFFLNIRENIRLRLEAYMTNHPTPSYNT